MRKIKVEKKVTPRKTEVRVVKENYPSVRKQLKRMRGPPGLGRPFKY